MFVVVAVPYQNLADQWLENLELFGIEAIPCYRSSSIWEKKLTDSIFAFNSGRTNFGCAVVVNNTFKSEKFHRQISSLIPAPLLLIGDECHHHGTEVFENKLPDNFKYRIGLSATPEHYFNERANQRLGAYYGEIVAEYTLTDALEDGVLTPYEYFVHPVALTSDEADEYADLSNEIARLFSFGNENETDPRLTILLSKRARLLGSASNKLFELRRILRNSSPKSHTLFYCGDGTVETGSTEDDKRQIEAVSEILFELGWNSSQFTSSETRRQRLSILENFGNGYIDAMVAIKCLDEGIDIPECSQAFILASSSNPRQFIQRRGRILRKSQGKQSSTIHDFLVFVDRGKVASGYDEKLVFNELSRVKEFALNATNRFDISSSLSDLLNEYGYSGYL